MNKKIAITSAVSALVLLVGLAIGLQLVGQPQRLEKRAASPTGTAIFKLVPGSTTLWTSNSQSVAGVLNTNSPILGYQVLINFTYSTAIPPASLVATVVTTTEPALNCLINRIHLDTTAKKYTIIVACGTPLTTPPATYTTNGVDKTVFTFNLNSSAPGILSYTFDNANSYVTSATDASDILAILAGGSYTVQTDATAPTVITNLATTNPTLQSIGLTWTAPSDSGPTGKASSYNIRYSTATITAANFSSATAVASPPTPGSAGAAESFTVTGLNLGTTYFFAIKSTDSAGNISTMSNIPFASTVNQGSLIFNVKFQGVSTSLIGKNVNLTLQQGTNIIYTFNNVTLTSAGGVYSATIPNINAGTYDVFLKGPASLRKKVAGITIANGTNTQNWPVVPPTLLAGDITGDNKIDLLDYAQLALKFNPGVTQTTVADLNFDNKIDLLDYSLLALNFNPGVTGN